MLDNPELPPETRKKLNICDLRKAMLISQAVSGKSLTQISEEQGRNRRWLYETLNSTENQAILAEIYSETIAEATSRMPKLVSLAFDAVEKLLEAPYADDRKIPAALAILKLAARQPQPCNCQKDYPMDI